MIRFVHSFNSSPLFINLYGSDPIKKLIGNILYFSLSVAYVKSLGQEIVLHTDSLGKALLGHLPYDEIYLTLDDIPKEINTRYWACGKIFAMEKEPLGSIHIDGDVFIKSKKVLDIIENNEWDFLALHCENASHYEGCSNIYWNDKGFCSNVGIDLELSNAYNTGIMGFNNLEMKDKFIERYKKLAFYFSSKYKHILDTDNYITPDLVAELLNAYQSSENYKVLTLLKDVLKDAKELGYLHVLTHNKFSQLDKCIETLLKISPTIYNKVRKLCKL